jgi:hypothetical protein
MLSATRMARRLRWCGLVFGVAVIPAIVLVARRLIATITQWPSMPQTRCRPMPPHGLAPGATTTAPKRQQQLRHRSGDIRHRDSALKRIMPNGPQRCRLTVITNADDKSDKAIERVTEAGSGAEKACIKFATCATPIPLPPHEAFSWPPFRPGSELPVVAAPRCGAH